MQVADGSDLRKPANWHGKHQSGRRMSHFSEDGFCGAIHYVPGNAGPGCKASAETRVSISPTCAHVHTHVCIVVTAHKLAHQGQCTNIRSSLMGIRKQVYVPYSGLPW